MDRQDRDPSAAGSTSSTAPVRQVSRSLPLTQPVVFRRWDRVRCRYVSSSFSRLAPVIPQSFVSSPNRSRANRRCADMAGLVSRGSICGFEQAPQPPEPVVDAGPQGTGRNAQFGGKICIGTVAQDCLDHCIPVVGLDAG